MAHNKTIRKKDKISSTSITTTTSAQDKVSTLLGDLRLQALFLALISFAFYFNTFHNGYAVDDYLVIEKNDAISSGLSGIPHIMRSDIFDSYYKQYNAGNQLAGGRYRPLALVTYAVEQQLFGQTGTIEEHTVAEKGLDEYNKLLLVRHVDNVLLYMLTVIVLLYFFRKIVFPSQPVIAFLSALLFAIHPIHTEVVANIKSRDEILSLLFITLTFILAWKYNETNKIKDLTLALICFFLALLSKEYALTLIVMIPLAVYIFRKGSIGESLRTALPYSGIVVIYLSLRYWAVPFSTSAGKNDELLNDPYLLATGTQKLATEIATLLNYLKLLLFPHPLSVDYSYNQIPYKSFANAWVWLSIIIHAGLVASMIILIKRRNVIGFAIAFYLFDLFLVSNLLFNIGATMGERLIFHSSVAFCMALAWLVNAGCETIKLSTVRRFALLSVVSLMVVLSAAKTIARNADWESNAKLYLQDVQTCPNSAVTNGNAGVACLELVPLQENDDAKKAMLGKALIFLNKAVSIYPRYTFAYVNRGTVYFEQGDMERAKQDWDTVKQQYPAYPGLGSLFASYYLNTAISKYGNSGKYGDAIAELTKGEAMEPQNIVLLFDLGFYYNLAGRPDSAINIFQRIVNIRPNDTLAAKCTEYIKILKSGGR